MENCALPPPTTTTTITTATTTTTTTATATTISAPDDEENKINQIKVKKEIFNDEIKDFAETAMNELLGWYGYGNPTNSSRDENRTTRTCGSHSGSNSSGPPSPKYTDTYCGWCGKPVDENTGLTSAAAKFCSELCFSQSRRANFKKNKTCDWCRHIRHTVSYVDSQDGANQLQFCSDKCLNQYKMHIFWRETRAHLEIHPHLHGSNESTSGTLITPDLWMTNSSSSNKSPELSSPSTTQPQQQQQEPPPQTSPLPLITVAHPSKLMSLPPQQSPPPPPPPLPPPSSVLPPGELKRRRIQKKKRKMLTTPQLHQPNDMPEDLRVRHPTKENDIKSTTNTTTMTTMEESLLNRNKLFPSGFLPPPTVLFPYPIVLPLPIPIPIPIPIVLPPNNNNNNNNKNNNSKIETQDNSSQTDDSNSSQSRVDEVRRPLRKRKGVIEDNKNVKKVIPSIN